MREIFCGREVKSVKRRVLCVISTILALLTVLLLAAPFIALAAHNNAPPTDAPGESLGNGLRVVVLIIFCLPAGGVSGLLGILLSALALRRSVGRERILPLVLLILESVAVLSLLLIILVGWLTG